MWSQDNKAQNSVGHQPAPVGDLRLAPDQRALTGIGKSLVIKGDISSAEDLTIDGRVEGTIALGENTLTVGVDAIIEADLTAQTIIISGTVTGKVAATARIEIQETGSADGDITAPRMAVRDGAYLHGRIDIGAGVPHTSANPFPVAV